MELNGKSGYDNVYACHAEIGDGLPFTPKRGGVHDPRRAADHWIPRDLLPLVNDQVSARSHEIGGTMRFIQAIILLAFLGAVGLFAVQNTEAITVDFWT